MVMRCNHKMKRREGSRHTRCLLFTGDGSTQIQRWRRESNRMAGRVQTPPPGAKQQEVSESDKRKENGKRASPRWAVKKKRVRLLNFEVAFG
nr:unnamed protein product [Digitaria exilis]